MNFFESLEHIKNHSKMFFQEQLTLAHLHAFVYGFEFGCEHKEIISPNGMNWEYFNSWLTGAIKKTLPGNRGWRERIEHISENENQAAEIFLDLLHKYSTGEIKITKIKTEPISLKWKRGGGNTKLEDFQKIEEIIVRFEILEHEFSKTKFKIGYNANDFRVYVEPQLEGENFITFRYTEDKENY